MRGLKQRQMAKLTGAQSRTPPGVRGLKRYLIKVKICLIKGRTPPGVRGLKLFHIRPLLWMYLSHPARGAWIETYVGPRLVF